MLSTKFLVDTNVTAEIAKLSGEMRGQLQARGQSRSSMDMIIAATAREHHLTLVTRNVRDFEGCDIPIVDPFREP